MSDETLNNDPEFFPTHLRDYQSLVDHINTLLDGQPTTEVGDKFAKFAMRFIPQTKIGANYDLPELRSVKSHDKGVDLTANSKDGQSALYIQSKKSVRSAEDVRSIIDGFNEFSLASQGTAAGEGQQLFMFTDSQPAPHCLLFTLSRTSGIFEAYEKRASTTKDFYDQLKSEGRFHVIDGDEILNVLRAAYRRFSELPYRLTINLDSDVRQHGNVFLGVISSDEIKRLYGEFGEALFFENVRDFLGVSSNSQKGRSTPNQDIVKTLIKNPEKMLERNNGIVIKSADVQQKDPKQLILTKGGIVNGCQTTMCIVDYANQPCYIQVKIVKTEPDEAWNITKAANYQTEVPDIDLEIARSLRPQLLRRYGFISGVEVEHGKKSALQLLDDMYNTKVTYDETRLLYIGLFSRSPNNLIAGNYTELIPDLVKQFHEEDHFGEQVFKVLLALEKNAELGKDKVRDIFSSEESLFNRYYDPDNPIYRCFVSILALCGAINVDITDRVQVGSRASQRIEGKVDIQNEFIRMKEFFRVAEILLVENPDTFLEFYIAAFNVWMREIRSQGEDEAEIRQLMYARTKRLSFSQIYTTLVNDMKTWKAVGGKK